MAKKFNYEKQYRDPSQPGHKPVRDLTRQEAMDRYSDYEIKRDMHNDMMYNNVQSMYSSFYAGVDPRRRNEMSDGGMVREDRQAMANLSNKPVHREYPRAGYYSNPYIDDSVQE